MGILKIGIARGITKEHLIPVFQSALDGGFSYLEITMNTAGAPELITAAVNEFKNRAVIGAGTVTNLGELDKALEAGAQFIVSPVVQKSIIKKCVESGIPVFPGALTPTEILQAWDEGAAMVKVFPVKCMGGPPYIKELKGPLNNIKLLACGGVTPENYSEYVNAGVNGIGIGGSLFRKEWIEKKEYGMITESAQRYSILHCS